MVIDYESAAIEQQSIEILEVIVVVIVVAVVRVVEGKRRTAEEALSTCTILFPLFVMLLLLFSTTTTTTTTTTPASRFSAGFMLDSCNSPSSVLSPRLVFFGC